MPGGSPNIAIDDQRQNDIIGVGGLVSLAITQNPSDLVFLQQMFDDAQWILYKAGTYREAMFQLNRDRVHVIICEFQLPDASWKDVLSHLAPWADRPRLIVVSSRPDEQLRSEVLAMGGFGVLRTPLQQVEVAYLIGSAWLDWKSEHGRAQKPAAITVAR
jgi:DNA-binding response OmpR family regulator